MNEFRLKEVCTTQKGVRYVATSVDCEDLYGIHLHHFEGIRLMNEDYSNEQIKVGANTLSLCGFDVRDYEFWVKQFNSLSHNIPRLYIIRKYDANSDCSRLVCGFDLLDDGRAWEGMTDTKHDTIADALRVIAEQLGGDSFSISLEEPIFF